MKSVVPRSSFSALSILILFVPTLLTPNAAAAVPNLQLYAGVVGVGTTLVEMISSKVCHNVVIDDATFAQVGLDASTVSVESFDGDRMEYLA